nr:MAG: hypothetical protein DIU57_06225 [Pseudomonadota bacterium]
MLGVLATPYLLVNALAPAILAIVVDLWGYTIAEAVALAAGLLSAASMEFMAIWYRRRPKAGAAQIPG